MLLRIRNFSWWQWVPFQIHFKSTRNCSTDEHPKARQKEWVNSFHKTQRPKRKERKDGRREQTGKHDDWWKAKCGGLWVIDDVDDLIIYLVWVYKTNKITSLKMALI